MSQCKVYMCAQAEGRGTRCYRLYNRWKTKAKWEKYKKWGFGNGKTEVFD